ncbi:hypothetical protein FSP39_001760 [Pinctada imbricata]|uniref:F-box domain-containing protein n=1 Tax=Pinctada imbricata TaxID=66713 RepID=A0AA88XUZ2_PINIB|nr:hypothetical protein FSP39_001760 [Pinctada imbricata]
MEERGAGDIINGNVDFTTCLPPELIERILFLLTAQELSRFSQVCISWREASNRDQLWMHHCMVRGWMRFGVQGEILHEQPTINPETNVSGTSPVFQLPRYISPDTRLLPICKWKHVFIRIHHLFKNWEKGRYTQPAILKGHRKKVTAMDCNRSCIVTGSEDKSLIIWDLYSCRKLYSINCHSDCINVIKIVNNTIYTGCDDSAIRVIDSTTGQLLYSLLGHAGNVEHILLYDDLLVSAATDRTLRVWCLKERKLKYSFKDHDDEIECLKNYGNLVVSGGWDTRLHLYDITRGKLLQKLEGHTEVVSCCYCGDQTVVSGSGDCDLRIWQISSGECLHILKGHTGEVYCLACNEEMIASGSQDSTVRLWSHQEGKIAEYGSPTSYTVTSDVCRGYQANHSLT